VLGSGHADTAWPVDGAAVADTTGDQNNVQLVADGSGGAIAAWIDSRSGSATKLFAQHMAAGGIDPLWPGQGALVRSSAASTVSVALEVADGTGAAVLGWIDSSDLYAQRVARYGAVGTPEPVVTHVQDVPNDNGGEVTLSWNASDLDLASDPDFAAYDVYRNVPSAPRAHAFDPAAVQTTFALLTSVPATHAASYSVIVATNGDSSGAGIPETIYQVVGRNAAGTLTWPSQPDSGYSVVDPPPAGVDPGRASRVLMLAPPAPDPAAGPVTLRFVLPSAGPVSLALFDAAGRRIRALASGTLGAGDYTLAWDRRDDAGRLVPAGLAFLRLEFAGRTLTRRIVLVR
jgi:hypothetical protein